MKLTLASKNAPAPAAAIQLPERIADQANNSAGAITATIRG